MHWIKKKYQLIKRWFCTHIELIIQGIPYFVVSVFCYHLSFISLSFIRLARATSPSLKERLKDYKHVPPINWWVIYVLNIRYNR